MPVSSVLVAGPSQWYINAGADGQWLHLGMCEGDTSIDLSHMYEGINVDGSGRGDYDRQWMSATASISGDLALWHEEVLDRIKVGMNDAAMTPGQYPPGSIGTMLRTEKKSFSLCITSQYASKEAYANANAHPVWYFPLVFPLPMRRNLSCRATRERIAFEAIMQTNGDGGGVLYHNQIAFSLPTPT